MKKIKRAVLSVYHKDGLLPVLKILQKLDVEIFSTGRTYDFIVKNGFQAKTVESLTDYPSILGGRVKTLHPKVFGGILARRDNKDDLQQLEEFGILPFDLVLVDLYPFEETLSKTEDEPVLVEKIDIGGISLIRAAAKNFKEVLTVSSSQMYNELIVLLEKEGGMTRLEDRRNFAAKAFSISSHYDTQIYNWMNRGEISAFKQSILEKTPLRYGENPHQKGFFFGKLDEAFEQLHGKAISYNNLLDLDAAIRLMSDFDETTFAVIKHNNACGLASRDILKEAWKEALAGDPVSAFGGVLISNRTIDKECAHEINKIFFEIIIAPDYEEEALGILQTKKNRIILKAKTFRFPKIQFRSVLNGALVQERDNVTESKEQLELKTPVKPTDDQVEDLLFANKIVKHTKSNAIVIVKNRQLVGSGTGQTSRVDALKQAIEKARHFELPLEGAVMASSRSNRPASACLFASRRCNAASPMCPWSPRLNSPVRCSRATAPSPPMMR